MNNTSPRFSLDGVDFSKVLTGAWVAFAGVAVTVLTQLSGLSFHWTVGTTDLGPFLTLLYAAAASVVVNLLRKYVTDHTQQQ